jgi:hypothetical protein
LFDPDLPRKFASPIATSLKKYKKRKENKSKIASSFFSQPTRVLHRVTLPPNPELAVDEGELKMV